MKALILGIVALLAGCGDSITAPPTNSELDACQVNYAQSVFLGPIADPSNGRGYWHIGVVVNDTDPTDYHFIDAVDRIYYPYGLTYPPQNLCLDWTPKGWCWPVSPGQDFCAYGRRPKQLLNLVNNPVGGTDYSVVWLVVWDTLSKTKECWYIDNDYYLYGKDWTQINCVWSPV